MKNGFIKLAAATPSVNVGAPTMNVEPIVELIQEAYRNGAAVVVLPELCVTGYTAGDLFLTRGLMENTERAVAEIVRQTESLKILAFVGAPVVVNGKTYDCAVAIHDGQILGIVPKSTLVSHSDTSESRYFTPADDSTTCISYGGEDVVFGRNQVFACAEVPALRVGCELSHDLWSMTPPSVELCKMGATVIVNLSATGEIVSRENDRRLMVQSQSARLISAYVYADAGRDESTTDGVFGGHRIIASRGKIIAEHKPFAEENITYAVVDLEHLEHDRRKNTAYPVTDIRTTACFSLDLTDTDISAVIERLPFIPTEEAERRVRCEKILNIQAHGLAKRIKAAHAAGTVIGLSGGLDSTLALLVACRAADILGMSRETILSVTMPCFGTTSRTRSNAELLASSLGTAFREIDIKEAVDVHFRDIGHDSSDLSVVYENAQARERTQILMDIANGTNALVVGTGDLSEVALGWATYNGDQMSNYGVNGSISKTLIRHVVSVYADEAMERGETQLANVLRDVLATPVSPELLPAKDGEISQKTEDIVGPYELHDFFLYRFVRWGETPEKIFRCAKTAFRGTYDEDTVKKWLNIFMCRFYIQQFKRSAMPDGPKVGSVALSPRGEFRMPSDACVSEEIKI